MATTPKYREVADELRDAITHERTLEVRGEQFPLGADAKLPTEPQLAELYEVGRSTVRVALAQLATEGLIETRGRSGTFVRLLQPLRRPLLARWQTRDSEGDTWTAWASGNGRTPGHDFEFRIVPASKSVAEALHLEPDELVVVREQLRFINEIPWSQAIGYYPYSLAREAGVDDPHDIPEGAARRMANAGFRDVRLTFRLRSRPATEEEQRTFDLAPGVNINILDRVMWNEERPIRLIREIDPADRNEWIGEISLEGQS